MENRPFFSLLGDQHWGFPGAEAGLTSSPPCPTHSANPWCISPTGSDMRVQKCEEKTIWLGVSVQLAKSSLSTWFFPTRNGFEGRWPQVGVAGPQGVSDTRVGTLYVHRNTGGWMCESRRSAVWVKRRCVRKATAETANRRQ